MGIFEAIILGLVQGLTEFLPVSSTGHLILTRSFFSADGGNALAFDAILQMATVLAVIVYFRRDIWQLLQALLRKLSRMPVNRRDETLLYAILIGTVPAVILGLLLESYMESTFRSPLFVAGILVIGSFLFMYAEWLTISRPGNSNITTKKGLQIGFFQALALLPGMSRSGATISGGMILGLSRLEAARFSFLLAVPVILGAGLKKLLDLMSLHESIDWWPILVSSAVAFFSGLFAIHFMLSFVRKHTLWPFIWYRLVLAGVVVAIFFLA